MLRSQGQQYALRPGTEPVALVRAMARTYTLLQHNIHAWHQRATLLHARIHASLRELQILEHGAHQPQRVPYVCVVHIPEESQRLWQEAVMCSQGSACGHTRGILSPTLLALGLPEETIAHSYRISWNHTTTDADIDTLLALWQQIFTA